MNQITHRFTEEQAKEIVAELMLDEDDDWTYKVKVAEKVIGPYPATIEIYDEDGEFIALF